MPVQPIIPPEWGWAYDIAVGQDWPQADEDALRRVAQAWTDAMEALLTVANGGNAAAANVNYSVQAVSSDEFNNYWSSYVNGDDSVVGQLARQCEMLATQSLSFAEQTEFTKLSIDIQLILLFIQLAIDFAMAFVTFGASTSEGFLATLITRLTVRSFLNELIKAVIMAVLPDVITQVIMLSEGHRSSFDVGEALQAAQMGVIGGLVGGAVGKFGGGLLGKLGEGFLGGLGRAAIHGAATNVLTNMATGAVDSVENQIHAALDPAYAKQLQQQLQDQGYADQKAGQNPLIAALNGAFTGALFHSVSEGSFHMAGDTFGATDMTLSVNGQEQKFTAVPVNDGSGSYALFDSSHSYVGRGTVDASGTVTVTPARGPAFQGTVVSADGSAAPDTTGASGTPDTTGASATSDTPTELAADQPPPQQPPGTPGAPEENIGVPPASQGQVTVAPQHTTVPETTTATEDTSAPLAPVPPPSVPSAPEPQVAGPSPAVTVQSGGQPAPAGGEPVGGGEPVPPGGPPVPPGGPPVAAGGEPVPSGGEPVPTGGEPVVGGAPVPPGGQAAPVTGAPAGQDLGGGGTGAPAGVTELSGVPTYALPGDIQAADSQAGDIQAGDSRGDAVAQAGKRPESGAGGSAVPVTGLEDASQENAGQNGAGTRAGQNGAGTRADRTEAGAAPSQQDRPGAAAARRNPIAAALAGEAPGESGLGSQDQYHVVAARELAGEMPTREELGAHVGRMHAAAMDGGNELAIAIKPGADGQPGRLIVIEGTRDGVGLPAGYEDYRIIWHTQEGEGPSAADVAAATVAGHPYELVTEHWTDPETGGTFTRTRLFDQQGNEIRYPEGEVRGHPLLHLMDQMLGHLPREAPDTVAGPQEHHSPHADEPSQADQAVRRFLRAHGITAADAEILDKARRLLAEVPKDPEGRRRVRGTAVVRIDGFEQMLHELYRFREDGTLLTAEGEPSAQGLLRKHIAAGAGEVGLYARSGGDAVEQIPRSIDERGELRQDFAPLYDLRRIRLSDAHEAESASLPYSEALAEDLAYALRSAGVTVPPGDEEFTRMLNFLAGEVNRVPPEELPAPLWHTWFESYGIDQATWAAAVGRLNELRDPRVSLRMGLLEDAIRAVAPEVVHPEDPRFRDALRNLSVNQEQGATVWDQRPGGPVDAIARRLGVPLDVAKDIVDVARDWYRRTPQAADERQQAFLRADVLENAIRATVPDISAQALHDAVRDLSAEDGLWDRRGKSGIADAEAVSAQLGVSLDDAKAIADAARDGYESLSHAARDDAIEALRDWLGKKTADKPAGATIEEVGREVAGLVSRYAKPELRDLLSRRYGLGQAEARELADALLQREPPADMSGHSGWRDVDAEAKLVAQIRRTLREMVRKAMAGRQFATDEEARRAETRIRESLAGTIVIAADEKMCLSCREQVSALKSEFPGVRVFGDGAEHVTSLAAHPEPHGRDSQAVQPSLWSHEEWSGGRQRPADLVDQFAWSDAAYQHFRQENRDVAAIAHYAADVVRPDGMTGFTPEEIAAVKEHLFVAEHPIVDYETGQVVMRRFDSDPDVADAWLRLRAGRGLPEDYLLLTHELTELRYLREHPEATYQEAHEYANQIANWQDHVPEPRREDFEAEWTDGGNRVLQQDSGGRSVGPLQLRDRQQPDDPLAAGGQGIRGRQTGGRSGGLPVPQGGDENTELAAGAGNLAGAGHARELTSLREGLARLQDDLTAELARIDAEHRAAEAEIRAAFPDPEQIRARGEQEIKRIQEALNQSLRETEARIAQAEEHYQAAIREAEERHQAAVQHAGAALPPQERIEARQGQLDTITARLDELAGMSARAKAAADALDFMKRLTGAYETHLRAAEQALSDFDKAALELPRNARLLHDELLQERRIRLNRLAASAESELREAELLARLVSRAARHDDVPLSRAAISELFAGLSDTPRANGAPSPRQMAIDAVTDALRVQEYFNRHEFGALLDGGSERLRQAWSERGDADMARRRWLRENPYLLGVEKDALGRRIRRLGLGLAEAWRLGQTDVALAIGDDIRRAEEQIGWIDKQLALRAKETHVTRAEPAELSGKAVRNALADGDSLRKALRDQVTLTERLDKARAAGDVARAAKIQQSLDQLRERITRLDARIAPAREMILDLEHAAYPRLAEVRDNLAEALAHLDPRWTGLDAQAVRVHLGDQLAAHSAESSLLRYRAQQAPGGERDLALLGNPRDWPAEVISRVEEIEGPGLNVYHAHRQVLKDWLSGATAAPDVIGGRLPVELTIPEGRWRVTLTDGTILEVRSFRHQTLIIDSGPVSEGGLSMLREDGGMGWWHSLLSGAVKLGPFALVGELNVGLPGIDLQYNPVLRRDFYTYDHGAELEITTVADPNGRFPATWKLRTEDTGQLTGEPRRTVQFYTKGGLQVIGVGLLQLAFGDPAHGLDQLIPLVQAGAVGLVQITDEATMVYDAATGRYTPEWGLSAEALVGDFIGLPSHIGDLRLQPSILGWDPNLGTVATNKVIGLDVKPLVEKVLTRLPFGIGDRVQASIEAAGARSAEAAALSAQHDAQVRAHLDTLRAPAAGPAEPPASWHPVPGGVRIAGAGDPIADEHLAPAAVSGAFVVEVHGDGGQLYLDGSPIDIGAADLPRLLRDAGWDGSTPIVLASCEAGQAGGAADQLAAALPGTDVVATDALVWRDKNGNLVAATEAVVNGRLQPTLVADEHGNLTGDGTWRLHHAGAAPAELPPGHPLNPARPGLISRDAEFIDLAARGLWRDGDYPSARQLSEEFGIPERNQRLLQALADRYKIAIDLRPSNPESARWLERGAVPKPEAIKAKTISALDVRLAPDQATRAALERNIGAVGFYRPAEPVLTLQVDEHGQPTHPQLVRTSESDQEWRALNKRYLSLMREYDDNQQALSRLDENGLFHVVDGVVYPYRAEIVNMLDVKLAPDAQARAVLEASLRQPAFFRPAEPVDTLQVDEHGQPTHPQFVRGGESQGEWAALRKRYAQRLAEYDRATGLVAAGKATEAAGVVKPFQLDPLPVPESVDPVLGPPVAGDHDMLNIKGLDDRQLPRLLLVTDTETGATLRMFEFRDAEGKLSWRAEAPEGTALRVFDTDRSRLVSEILDSLGNRTWQDYAPNPGVWFERLANEPGRAKWEVPPMPAESGELLAGGMGIMHGATAYWTPSSEPERRIYHDLMTEYGPGGDLLVRFQAGRPPVLVHADTPVISGLLKEPDADTLRRLREKNRSGAHG